MYGMVNRAVEDMVCALHGKDMWEKVKARAGVDVDVFISDEPYDDKVTYQLVGAASELTGTPTPQVLEAFGEFWILKTAREGYGGLMDAGGKTFPEFLGNLPHFHAHVAMVFPKLRPPEFSVTNLGGRALHLHYYTHRKGLAPFVVGLLKGLGKHFNTPIKSARLIDDRDQGADHDTFLVEW